MTGPNHMLIMIICQIIYINVLGKIKKKIKYTMQKDDYLPYLQYFVH